ncbi:hypothetical protein MLD38_029600 [Melastoma candidum]|uniref:Uncharacterized protein n=1 Tax=Melastoma candidum TaxID=119954 RepID=A0ACB9N5D5_9MYRT|nr:hypothetical protein MLD38_029600 [Melastoma candidum]
MTPFSCGCSFPVPYPAVVPYDAWTSSCLCLIPELGDGTPGVMKNLARALMLSARGLAGQKHLAGYRRHVSTFSPMLYGMTLNDWVVSTGVVGLVNWRVVVGHINLLPVQTLVRSPVVGKHIDARRSKMMLCRKQKYTWHIPDTEGRKDLAKHGTNDG